MNYSVLFQQGEDFISQINKEFASLSNTQFNWKPAPERWSIGQCIQHLYNTNAKYEPIYKAVKAGSYRPGFWNKINPFSRWMGKKAKQWFGPQTKRKFKSPLSFQPVLSSIDKHVLNQLITQQERLLSISKELIKLKPEKTIITSPAAGILTFPLSDAIALTFLHEQRHLAQAMRVKQHRAFPNS